MPHSGPLVRRTKILITPESARVVLRTFLPHPVSRIGLVVGRIKSLSNEQAARELKAALAHFTGRHPSLEETLLEHYRAALVAGGLEEENTADRRLLIGAYFTSEYAFESAALFNPSIVVHPDQTDQPPGSVRFVMSLRATGEGHVSSLTFRTGTVDAAGQVSVDPVAPYALVAPPRPEAAYDKPTFARKLSELGFDNDFSRSVLETLPEAFTLARLKAMMDGLGRHEDRRSDQDRLTRDKILWLAWSNYSAFVSDSHPLSSWVVFPASPAERNGIEDARFVRFTDDDGSVRYYATYTAWDGSVTLPQLIETDFNTFKMITLNGPAVRNKGMALFPRRIGGRFAMLSRQDNDCVFLMYSDNIHFWHHAQRIACPEYGWEFIQIGNCGSPVETDSGWLVLTHGVGSFRQYAIGAMLLDRDDPSRVIGRLAEPLIVPSGGFRDGYVPNVVYTCGSLVHGDKLIVPYALADLRTTFSVIDLPRLLRKLGGKTLLK